MPWKGSLLTLFFIVFLFETETCEDVGGWVAPQTPEIPKACNYNVSNVLAYAVVWTEGTQDHGFRLGGRRGGVW
jgi:hypothetical protein